MFISDLFEAQQKQTLVLIPGGFHPFHPGHLSLYRSAEAAFPGATIVYVATDDQKDRPFPFAAKQKLAQIAGVNPKNFQLVRSPFVAKEVTEKFDPNTTVLIFARSEKDRNEHPKPGGVKKDGSPSYLQPYTKGDLAPMSQHGYMAYLPTVEFDAGPSGVTSATQIREMWPQADDAQKNAIVTDLYPKNTQAARQILDKYLGGAVAEAQSMGAALGNALSKVEPGSKLAKNIKHNNDMVRRFGPEARTMTAAPDGYHIDSKGYVRLGQGVAEAANPAQQAAIAIAKKKELDEKSVSKAQFRTMAAAAHNPEFAKKVGISGKVAKEFHKADKKQSYKSLPARVEEDGPGMDPNVIQLKKRAKLAHPFASSDEEALALYVNDREIKDVDNLEREQNRELKMINRIEDGEKQLQKEIDHIDRELAALTQALKAR